MQRRTALDPQCFPERRLLRTLATSLSLLVAGAAWLAVAPPASAAQDEPGVVDVIEVSGRLDPVLVDFIESSLDRSEREEAVALVLQLNSPGVLVDAGTMAALAERLADASVTVG